MTDSSDTPENAPGSAPIQWSATETRDALDQLPDDLEWNGELADRGEQEDGDDYVEGFNDGIAHARQIARHLRLADARIRQLEDNLAHGKQGSRVHLDEREISVLRKIKPGRPHSISDRITARDVLSRVIAAGLASPRQSDAMVIPCPVHDGTLHGAEAEELRAGIESLIEDGCGSCTDGDDLRSELIVLLDRVNARDSLAYLEVADRGAETRGESSAIGTVDDVVDQFGRLSRDDQRTVRDRIDEMTDDG